jgi:hypothetical protein
LNQPVITAIMPGCDPNNMTAEQKQIAEDRAAGRLVRPWKQVSEQLIERR